MFCNSSVQEIVLIPHVHWHMTVYMCDTTFQITSLHVLTCIGATFPRSVPVHLVKHIEDDPIIFNKNN